jgi:hypothetical protein
MTYYVYIHKSLDDKIFYVGKGKGKRAFSKSRRSKAWQKKAQEGYSVGIIKNFEEESLALNLEISLINTIPDLVNKRVENTSKDFPEDIVQHITYSEQSPSGLIWIKPLNRKQQVGCIAGVKTYRDTNIPTNWTVMFRSKRYLAHRLVLYLNSKLSDSSLVVNHIDCNPFNNKLSNLELCTVSENNKRKSNTLGIRLSRNNNSGITGIRETFSIKNNKVYIFAHACISLNGKTINKKYSYSKYGKQTAWELAKTWRNNMLMEKKCQL